MRLYEITKRELDAQKLKVSKDEWDGADDEMKSDIKSHNRSGVIQDALEKMDGGIEKLKRDLDNKSILAWSDGGEGLIGARQGPKKIIDMVTIKPVNLNGKKRSRVLPGYGNKEALLKYAEGRQLVDLEWNGKAQELFNTPAGIYIWTHPKFGIFYIGIMGSDLEQRWTSHVNKMLGRYKDQANNKDDQGNSRSTAPTNWVKFSQDLLSKDGSQIEISSEQAAKELSAISVSFYPINKPEGVGTSHKKPGERGYEEYDRWKKGLEAIEHRLVSLVTGMKMNKNNPSKMRLLNATAEKLEKEMIAQRALMQKVKNS
jgi:hypothetical protein